MPVSLLFTIFLFFSSFFICLFLVPYSKRVGKKLGIIDKPDKRKINHKFKVRIGGLSIVLSVLISFILLLIFQLTTDITIINIHIISLIIIIGSLNFCFGLFDDIYDISPFIKLFGQILIGAIAFKFGFKISSLSLAYEYHSPLSLYLNQFGSLFVTIFWISGVTNSINWIDGKDGLATGISLIAFFFLGIINFEIGNTSLAIYSITIVGALSAFLLYNFYPSKILMGDGGSYFLGANLAILTLATGNNENSIIYHSGLNLSLLFSLLILFIPLTDMFYVILFRLINRDSPFLPDRNHIQYRLEKGGISDVNIFFILCSITLFISGLLIYNFSFQISIISLLVSSSVLIWKLKKLYF